MNRKGRRQAAKTFKVRSGASEAEGISAFHAEASTHLREGRWLDAQLCCEQALALEAENPKTLHLAGIACFNSGQYGQAIEWFSRAIRRQPESLYLADLGAALARHGRIDEAVQAVDRAVQLAPDDAGLWHRLGNILLAADRKADALLCFQQALKLDGRQWEAAFKAGHLLYGFGRFEEALVHLRCSAELKPDHAPTLQMRALVQKSLNRLDEAQADNLRAIELDPTNAGTCGNLADVLRELGRYEEAVYWYDRSLAMAPNVAQAITNRAYCLAELARFDEAMKEYERSLAIDPSQAYATWNLSLLQMLTGDFEASLRGREARLRIPHLATGHPKLHSPPWHGKESVEGRTVFVWADEGIGDAIQFARYVPMLAARGARVILAVEEALGPLLSGLTGVVECLAKTGELVVPPVDLHCSLGNLPWVFGTRLETIPADESYLPSPAADRVQAWEDRLGPRGRMRVGLVWSGNPKHANDRNRSIPLKTLARVLDVDATFISLQKEPRPADAEFLRERTDIVDVSADLSDFAETAALVSCLDLVITVDTSVAHLSGALGRPTWILLPYVPDYRWLLNRDDSPWYPTVRLFRQTKSREYDSVVDRVRAELMGLLRDRSLHQGL
jgi:tetratricopeptide (TPR) repeat protein